ncbi:UDP-N-acetylmuramoyl-tripeptide--D-alanyl-D-alanine ligase [bacterium]|nr:UDP-N-acetylmuramoyl-tripeptide--D-alanyl-D-alanine ligase [bacterium]
MLLTTADIRSALPWAVLCGPEGQRGYARVATDSRADCSGTLFVALAGERFDGNRFVAAAAAAGAAGAIVGPGAEELPDGLQCFRVKDSLEALQRLAAWHRRRMSGCRVVGVTGSNGKSTTKQMIAAVLGRAFRTQATPGNLNNHIGVPLTLLSLEPETQVLVAEMGANHPGEIRHLAGLAAPDAAVVTNIAPAHLEGFGSVEGVRDAKLELFEQTVPAGWRLYNSDDPRLAGAVPQRFPDALGFGLGEAAETRATEISLDDQARAGFSLDGACRVRLGIPGRHNVLNALAAAAVGKAFGMDYEGIRAGLEAAEALGMRMQMLHVGALKVLNDCYNANPSSVTEALNTLEQIEHTGRRLAVLGEMLELGHLSGDLHARVARDAAARELDLALFVGKYAQEMKESFIQAGGQRDRVLAATDSDTAWTALREFLRPGDLVLLKASRGMRLETVLRAIEQEFV